MNTSRVHTLTVAVLAVRDDLAAVVDVPRAVGYLVLGKAESVADRDGIVLRSAGGLHLPCPAVVRLRRYVRLPATSRVTPWTRAGLLRRDAGRCAYCGGRARTVDHLVPVSRGGRSTWLNTVAACGSCNVRKAARTPDEAGMPLRFAPTEPTVRAAMLLALGSVERQALAGLGIAVA